VQLIADRFAVDDRGGAIDLATGEPVTLVVSSAGGPTEQAQWAERCAWFSSIVHPSIATLVDYGPMGASKRFEAWDARDAWQGTASAARLQTARASRFIAGSERTAPVGGLGHVARRRGSAVVLPRGDVGLRAQPGVGTPTLTDTGQGEAALAGHRARDAECTGRRPNRWDDVAVPGVQRWIDPRLHAVVEALNGDAADRAAALALWSPDAAEASIAVHTVARGARLAGYVPVAVSQLSTDVRKLLKGRTLVLFACDMPVDGWRSLIETMGECQRPHLMVFVGNVAVSRVHTIALRPRSPAQLIEAVRPESWRPRLARLVGTAARRSGGWQGRFEGRLFREAALPSRLHGSCAAPRMSGTGRRGRPCSAGRGYERREPAAGVAAERAVAYAATHAPAQVSLARAPAAGELIRLRRLVRAIDGWLATGRRQAAERTARSIMHAFARRGEWREACESGLLLAQSLVRRGRVACAQEALDAVGPWSTQAGTLPVVQRLAILRGRVLAEQGLLAEAEALLETVLASAISAERNQVVDAGIELMRTLFWHGRFEAASQRWSAVYAERDGSPRDEIRLLAMRSRLSIGRGRAAEAVADAAQARDLALPFGDRALIGRALYACALAQLAAGDRVQAAEAAQRACAAARAARDPMLALNARVLAADIGRQQGQRGPATTLVRRVGRVSTSKLPRTVALRVELLREMLASADAGEVAERLATRSGFGALRLLAPVRPQRNASAASADDITALLQCCQSAEEDHGALTAIAAQLRRRLRAAAVGFFGIDHDQIAWRAGDGPRMDHVTAERVRTANQLVLPHAGERIEAGVPIRYAGRVIGVLAAIWAPGALWESNDVAMLLSVGATAAGPALSAALTSSVANASRGSELLGISSVIADVRLAVERAAAAPFPVLVEGESGCGKELVARLLHKLGPRRDRPFCTLNCAALPEDLVESELFGHARGAFTGAAGERRGVFEDAHTGTLFLDEVGELSARAQAKLLRAIQEGEIRRVGENVCRHVDVRLLTATNRDLRAEAASGRFRADLLYRLDVIRIALPPLRARREDIPVIAEHYWREATQRMGSRSTLSASTIAALARHDWPGNVRELQNVLAALAVRAGKRGVVPPSALPPQVGDVTGSDPLRLDAARRAFDRTFVRAALVRTGGQRSRAAEELGVSRQGLAKLIGRLGIEV
jgi:DNA-binding NtrC family response regulator